MKLKVRYDESVQTIDLDAEATEQLWVSLSLEGDDLTQDEKEQLIQEEWEKQFNRPDYNSWHKFDRHHGYSKAQPGKNEGEDDVDVSEPLMSEVADNRVFRKDEIERERHESHEAVCEWVRKVLAKKPKWAEAFIAVRIDGFLVKDYAAAIDVKDASTVSKWLARAEKKLREGYKDRQI